MMQTDGLNLAIATRGLSPLLSALITIFIPTSLTTAGVIDTFVLSLRFEYPALAVEVSDFSLPSSP
jgi:hypothetical protein